MKHDLTLVALSQEQIAKAKEVNGKRKPDYARGHMRTLRAAFRNGNTTSKVLFYLAENFPDLFGKAVETDKYEISNFEATFNLVDKLIALTYPHLMTPVRDEL